MSKKKDDDMTKEEQVEIEHDLVEPNNIEVPEYGKKLIPEIQRGKELEKEYDEIVKKINLHKEERKPTWISAITLSDEEGREVAERSKKRNEMLDELSDFFANAEHLPNGGIRMNHEDWEVYLKLLEEKNNNTKRLIELIKKLKPFTEINR